MIDEKGKLFGKINIIDLLVILVVIAIVIVLGLKVLGRGKGLPTDGKGTKITYTVQVQKVEPKVYESLKGLIPGTLMANGECLNGQITAVTSTAHIQPVETADGRIVIATDPIYLDLLFTIEAYITNPVTSAVGTQEVRIGKSHIVKTDLFELTGGTILTCHREAPAA